VDEPKVESSIGICCAPDIQRIAKQIEKGVHDARAKVSAEVENSKIAAERLLKRGRYTVEDCISETAHTIKHHPFGFIVIAFAAGAALGFLAPRYARK
jgi:ElaB/YqjD/DUF883 family membrane-anchored ribosome-binding protein